MFSRVGALIEAGFSSSRVENQKQTLNRKKLLVYDVGAFGEVYFEGIAGKAAVQLHPVQRKSGYVVVGLDNLILDREP